MELRITPSKYTTTHANAVESVKRPIPSGKTTIPGAPASVGRGPDAPKDILGVDVTPKTPRLGTVP